MKQLYQRRKSLRRLFSFSSSQRSSIDEVDTEKSICIYQESDAKPLQKPNWRCFTYAEIHIATNGFHQGNLVGSGGHAEVFRGVLADGRVIAVKRLTRDENSLPLTWNLRYRIAVGTAQGLHYLHKGCQRRIIHRDIKTSNILLTANFEPQISDFGLAKWLPSEWTYCAVKPIEGTVGYLAPEYFMHGIVDEKTDVFAFGVFLLEIISGRKPVDGSHRSLLSWAKTYLEDDMVHLLVDPRLDDEFDVSQLRQLAFVASLCVRATASWRPSMTEVLQLLTHGETPKNGWKMSEGEEEDLWDFEDLDECDKTTSSSMSSS